MTRPHRQRLALFLSLILAAFVFCQGMAQAMTAAASLPLSKPMPAAMSCHDGQPTQSGPTGLACPSDCEYVVKASDSGPQLSHLAAITAIVAFILPDVCREAGPIQLASLPLHNPVTDPPPTLRFHRFRE